MTDVGLLALSNISCLQNMMMLHVKGVTPNGLAAALLACSGLTKVKLNSSFKSLISKPLLDHLEARGCMLQWRDKPFQVYSILFMYIFREFYVFHGLLLLFSVQFFPI